MGRYEQLKTALRRASPTGAIPPDTIESLSSELIRIANNSGRAQGYAAIAAVHAALTPEPGGPAASDHRFALIRGLILRLRDPGLLRDLADLLEEQDANAHRV